MMERVEEFVEKDSLVLFLNKIMKPDRKTLLGIVVIIIEIIVVLVNICPNPPIRIWDEIFMQIIA
ncbi:MAG: hypothetical protein R2769_02830 [Saprospiraceae bacterium]